MTEVALGLDLSLRGAGMVALPFDWGGDWSKVQRYTAGESLPRDAKEALRVGRLHRVASDVIAFARTHSCTAAIIEQYSLRPGGGTMANAQAHALGELGGVVKHQLVQALGLVPDVVAPSSARKLILGKLPRRDVKVAVVAALTRMRMPLEWSNDEADAFVVANYLAAERGGFAFLVEPPVEEKRPRRRAA
jgi:hypothetical protein